MNKLLTTLALTLGLLFGGVAAPAAADPSPVPWPGETPTECQILELEIATLEHDNARLVATLEEERDEHADELRDLDARAWALQQAHDAEVNELSAALGDADVALREERAKVAEADMRIIRQQATIKRLRDKIRSLR